MAKFHDLLHFDDRHFSRLAHHRIEVPRRLPEDQITDRIGLPRLHEREIASDGGLQHVVPSVELAHVPRLARYLGIGVLVVFYNDIALLYDGAESRGSVEGRNASATRSHALRQSTLKRLCDL